MTGRTFMDARVKPGHDEKWDTTMTNPRIRSIPTSEAQQVFREFVEKLSRLQRPRLPLAHPRGANGHLRSNGQRRTPRPSRRQP
jgi:hypothetical protein